MQIIVLPMVDKSIRINSSNVPVLEVKQKHGIENHGRPE